jgi:hypothetical protein
VSAAHPVVWRSGFILMIKWVGELLFYVLTLLYVALVALIFYRGGQAEIERQVNAAIEQEDQAVCGRLGIGAPHDDDCTAALTDVVAGTRLPCNEPPRTSPRHLVKGSRPETAPFPDERSCGSRAKSPPRS